MFQGSKTDGKSKKKKENLLELHHDPPIVKTLGSAVMPLKNLVSGEMQIFSVCTLEPCYNNTDQQHINEKVMQSKCESNLTTIFHLALTSKWTPVQI